MKQTTIALAISVLMVQVSGAYAGHHETASDAVIAEQNSTLIKNTAGKGFGPQAPRDLS